MNFPVSTIMLGTTIHDLRTHLTAIIAASDMLADELHSSDNETVIKLINSIIRNSHNMDLKLSQILKSDAYSDGERITIRSTDAKAVINEIINEISPIARNRTQSITANLPEYIPQLKVHKEYVEYVLRTLLHNASKFSNIGGNIHINLKIEGDTALIEVADSGIGIPETEHEKIFRPGNQVLRSDSTVSDGSGIGLTMAKYLVELNGGKMWVKSSVGEGSSFYVSLPVHGTQEQQQ